ncbi:6-bladed beta-propeller protein [Fodinibius salinus]|uniref:6-bladed beta-propeller protein n=1 Tax=Fodinibius salinus TaxID=860790 RepID=A0A5D3YJ84_9BACT|nr:6-bladed beta-propeller [Fodinibius salinus]TYP93622.1 6-bladed beta-propeller protein [Fodinibius salinus]
MIYSACSSSIDWPEYINKLPQSKSYEYVKAGEWNKKKAVDTLAASLWIDPKNPKNAVYSTPADLVKVGDNYWICDPMMGSIFKFSSDGNYLETVSARGRGPGETLKPAALYSLDGEDGTLIYTVDPPQKSILIFDKEGNEINRIPQETIDRSLFNNWVIALRSNRLVWPTYNLDNHVIIKADSSGMIQDSSVHRLIPKGHQPATYNATVYDEDPSKNDIFYAYRGIPVLFYKNPNAKKMVNLLPRTNLEDLNTPLNIMPHQEKARVKNIIKDIYSYKDRLLVHFRNKFLVISKNSWRSRAFIFVDSSDNKIIPQKIVLAGNDLFLINRFNLKIYKFSLSEIEGL